MISLLQISCWVYQWRNFENLSIFGKVMDKSLVSCFLLDHGVQCAAKQVMYPLRFFAIFLATARNFYMKFHTFITHSLPRKTAKQRCIIFNYDKVIKFLVWPRSHFWCLQKERRVIFCNVTQKAKTKGPSWFEQQNKQFADTRSVHRQLSCTHLIAKWSFTYNLAIVHFTVAGYPRSPAVLASSRWQRQQ